MKANNPKSRFCDTCPLGRNKLPNEPCAKGLELFYSDGKSSKASKHTAGCPWGINSSEYQYCFWVLCKDLQDSPIPDKEICNLLNITNSALERTIGSALSKLRAIKGTDQMIDFKETVIEFLSGQDSDQPLSLPEGYNLEEFATPKESEGEDEDAKLAGDIGKKPKKPRKGHGMPLHRSGDKVDIWGIYSRKKLEEMRKKNGK